MSLLGWSDVLDVHVDAMNSEHKKLISFMNIVYDKNQNKVSKGEIKLALDDLVKYTITHFKDEEKYMESISYPKLNSHKLIHEDLLAQVGVFVEEFDKERDTLPNEFFVFLKEWLVEHIIGVDTKYGNFAAGK